MEKKRITSSNDETAVLKRVEEVDNEVKSLDRRFSEFQQAVSETNSRFGGRIGQLEARNEVQDEQVRQVKESVNELKTEIREYQAEQKNSLSEMKAENKESMLELKQNYKEILDAVTPIKHKIDDVDHLKREVNELKAKPGKTWESIKEKGLGWAVALVLALIGAALGLSQYL